MRVTNKHPDRGFIQVYLNDELVADCIDADTIGGYVVVQEFTREEYWFLGRTTPLRPRGAGGHTLFGKVEIIDARTGKPYDAVYQAAEAAAIRGHT